MSETMTSKKEPPHIACLKRLDSPLLSTEGREIVLWELSIPADVALLSKWASQFRQHYCLDSEIDTLREGTGLSRKDYLLDLIFPDKNNPPGPSIRAGDFGEILVSDYLEHVIGYWVPRCKYREKAIRDESVKGVDILGFLMPAPLNPSRTDTLIAFEVKAQLTGTTYGDRLQNAIDDSSKDYIRRAYSLNATKRRLIAAGNNEAATIVQRFQNASDSPYVYRSGAAAVLSETAFDKDAIELSTKVSTHNNQANLDLVVIRGKDLMELVHALYERAANEA